MSEEIMGLADKNKKRLQDEKNARLQAEDKTTEQDRVHSAEGSLTGAEVLDEISQFIAELKKKCAQGDSTAYPSTGSE